MPDTPSFMEQKFGVGRGTAVDERYSRENAIREIGDATSVGLEIYYASGKLRLALGAPYLCDSSRGCPLFPASSVILVYDSICVADIRFRPATSFLSRRNTCISRSYLFVVLALHLSLLLTRKP
jgi:hypothetical protein